MLISDAEIEVAPAQEERTSQFTRLVEQWLRRIQIAAQGRFALTENSGFLESHGFAGVAQIIGVIDANAGDQCDIGIDHVDRVQTPAQPDFQHHRIKPGLLKQPERREGAHFEVSQGSVAAPGLDCCKGFAQLRVSGLDAIELHPLVVTQQVRRIVDTNAQALRPQQ
ncbi:hypothetical protein D3C85_416320 [compost metagenome]